MVLVLKWQFFKLFFLLNIDQENVFYDILERKTHYRLRKGILWYSRTKKRLSRLSKQEVQKVEKFSMVLVQKWPFFLLFFLGNMRKENVFYDILKWKNAFLGYKNKKFKQSKIDIFPKGLTHGFGRKMAIFRNFFF